MLDETESQKRYMETVKTTVVSIYEEITRSPKVNPYDVRVSVITFRDYQPNDRDPNNAARVYEFTSDIKVLKYIVNNLHPFGGGDGPEAQTLALLGALKSAWKEDATKIAILITDSPPHGIGEAGDDYPERSPEGD